MTSIFGLQVPQNACDTVTGIRTRRGFLSERRSQTRRSRIRFNLNKWLLSLSDNDFIHNFRTLNVRVLWCVYCYNLLSVTMVGRRVNSFRCWSAGKSHVLLPARVGGSVAGLQIPSMTYPPSSTVRHFNQILISNLNAWLIADGALFVIRCIISLSNKTKTN